MTPTTAADVLVATAAAAGIQVCFANPGTSEMHIAGALERATCIKPVLTLHENVATGAADGYARIAGVPAMTLLHLGPGLSNGLANLHNARRAGSPVLNVVGDMTSWLKPNDPLLETDIVGLAHSVSKVAQVTYTARRQQCSAHPQRVVVASASLADDVRSCISATRRADSIAGSRIATLIVPHDLTWAPCEGDVTPLPKGHNIDQNPQGPQGPQDLPTSARTFLDDCADAIARAGASCTMLLGGDALQGAALDAAGNIAAATGATLMAENAFARADRGVGRPRVQRLPYFPDTAAATLRRASTLVVVGTRLPVPMFGYRDGPQSLVSMPDELLWELDLPEVSCAAALEHMAARIGATIDPAPPVPLPAMPKDGPLTAHAMCALLVRRQPANATIVDESITAGAAYWDMSHAAPPFTHLTLTGGAIGCGPPLALGAALADRGRRVINLQADGSAAYTLQALWTQARECARVLTIICVNNAYHILRVELHKQHVEGSTGALTNLTQPSIDWVKLAAGFGVPGVAASTVTELDDALVQGLAVDGPFLIAAQLP